MLPFQAWEYRELWKGWSNLHLVAGRMGLPVRQKHNPPEGSVVNPARDRGALRDKARVMVGIPTGAKGVFVGVLMVGEGCAQIEVTVARLALGKVVVQQGGQQRQEQPHHCEDTQKGDHDDTQ